MSPGPNLRSPPNNKLNRFEELELPAASLCQLNSIGAQRAFMGIPVVSLNGRQSAERIVELHLSVGTVEHQADADDIGLVRFDQIDNLEDRAAGSEEPQGGDSTR